MKNIASKNQNPKFKNSISLFSKKKIVVSFPKGSFFSSFYFGESPLKFLFSSKEMRKMKWERKARLFWISSKQENFLTQFC